MATTKKRQAQTQPGPVQKKSKINQSESVVGNKKRSRPITANVQEDSEDSEEPEEDVELDGEMTTSTPKDPTGISHPCISISSTLPDYFVATRESHKLQKLQHQSRRSQKPNASLLSILKPLWFQARSKSFPSPKERQKHVKNLMDALRGNVKDIVLKHDASRIVQTVVKYGGKKEREEIAGELKGSYKELAQSRYSKVRGVVGVPTLTNVVTVPSDKTHSARPLLPPCDPLRIPLPHSPPSPPPRSLCRLGRCI